MDDTNRGSGPEMTDPPATDPTPGPIPEPWSEPPVTPPLVSPVGGPPDRDVQGRGHISTGAVAFISAVLGAAAVVGILALLGLFTSEPTESAMPPPTAPPTTVVQQITNEIITDGGDIGVAEAVAVKVVPSVVTVEVGSLDDEDGVLTLTGSGSGVILDDGFVVTNEHVIADATISRVVLQDGRTLDAEIIGADPYTDLAVLRIDIEGLSPIGFGSTDDMVIGQLAVAVGNPLGQVGGASLTTGVISALSRTVELSDETLLYGMLQTDAPITSGSSGGALVDADGALVGITSAIGVGRGGAEGIGYAIPVELVTRVTDEIIETGAVRHTFLGIYGSDYVETTDDGVLTPAGAEIAELWEEEGGSAAGRAGFLAGDIIILVDDSPIAMMEDLVVALRLYHVGDEITMTVDRDGENVTAVVVLDERPDDPEPISTEESSGDE